MLLGTQTTKTLLAELPHHILVGEDVRLLPGGDVHLLEPVAANDNELVFILLLSLMVLLLLLL